MAEQNNPCLGAIASSKCAQLYQMHILQEDVQDITGNATRFICISKTPGFSADANKISLCLAVPHKPRALYHLLHKFANHDFLPPFPSDIVNIYTGRKRNMTSFFIHLLF